MTGFHLELSRGCERLVERLRVRVTDFDFARVEVTVRRGAGTEDRVTVLAES